MTDGAAVWDTETGLCLHTQTVQTRFEGTCTQHRPMNRKGVGRFRCAHKSDYYLSFLDSRILSQGYVNSKFAQYCSSHSPPLSPYSYCFTAQTCRLLHCPSYMSCAQRSQDLQGNDFWPVASATSRTQTITQPLSILSFPAPLRLQDGSARTSSTSSQPPRLRKGWVTFPGFNTVKCKQFDIAQNLCERGVHHGDSLPSRASKS